MIRKDIYLDSRDSRIICTVNEHPGIAASELLGYFNDGTTAPLLRYRIHSLVKAGFLRIVKERKVVRVYPVERGDSDNC